MDVTTKTIEERTRTLVCGAARLCDEKRAEAIRVLDVRGLCSYTDFLLIATVASAPQMKGIARDIEKSMREAKLHQIHRTGIEEGTWVLLDYGDLLVHLFTPETRDYYELDALWGDAPDVEF